MAALIASEDVDLTYDIRVIAPDLIDFMLQRCQPLALRVNAAVRGAA